MPSRESERATRAEWRELGFYYALDESSRVWRFVGSTAGLRKLCDLLQVYAEDPANQAVSEHEHYGPYGTLEIMTWHEAGIDGHSIHGSIADLLRLRELIAARLEGAAAGSVFEIGDGYAAGALFKLRFEVWEGGFDPASMDPYLSTGDG